MSRIQISGPSETVGVSGTLSLVTLAETLAYLELTADSGTQDALLQTLIDSACWGAFGLMGGRFLKRPATAFNFAITPDEEGVIYLHQYPVGTISALETGYFSGDMTWTATTTLTTSDYYSDLRAGRVWSAFPVQSNSVRVAWTGGYSTVPADAKEAIFQWVGVKLQRLRKARWDATTMQTVGEGYTFEGELPAAAARVFQKYALAEGSVA